MASVSEFLEKRFRIDFGSQEGASSHFIFNRANIPTYLMLTDSLEALGMTLGIRDSIAVLAAAQVDKKGNINGTRVGDIFLVGSGGANDIGSNAKETVVVAPHEPLRLVKEVSYVTVPGERVTRLSRTRLCSRRLTATN